MPNKTIYVKDSDLPLWEKAQENLGESISAAFVDYLRERMETGARKAGRVDEVLALKALLAEVNVALNLDIELHPSWRYPILDQNTVNHGFKLHQRGSANPDRTMSLVVWPLDFDNSGRPSALLKERIKNEIREFWNGKTTREHIFVDTTNP